MAVRRSRRVETICSSGRSQRTWHKHTAIVAAGPHTEHWRTKKGPDSDVSQGPCVGSGSSDGDKISNQVGDAIGHES